MIWLGYRLQLWPQAQCRSSLTDTEWQYASSLSTKRSLQFCNGRALARQLLQRYQFRVGLKLPLPLATGELFLHEPHAAGDRFVPM